MVEGEVEVKVDLAVVEVKGDSEVDLAGGGG